MARRNADGWIYGNVTRESYLQELQDGFTAPLPFKTRITQGDSTIGSIAETNVWCCYTQSKVPRVNTC